MIMKKKDIFSTVAMMLAAFGFGCIMSSYANSAINGPEHLRRAYEVEKARADAARVLIDEITHDWHEFYDSTGSGDAFGDWLDAEEMKY